MAPGVRERSFFRLGQRRKVSENDPFVSTGNWHQVFEIIPFLHLNNRHKVSENVPFVSSGN
jgi:hypothetical protein